MQIIKIASIVLALILLVVLVGPFLVPVPPLKGTVDPATLADPDSHFIRVNGVNIHYKIMGQGQPVMVLLHGFGASLFSWHAVMPSLSQHGTVIAYDRPAFGLTERPMPGDWKGENPYSPQAQVDLLFGLMDALSVPKAILVGNSAGGTVAVSAALAHPERVQALVLVDAAIYTSGGSSSWLRLFYGTPQMDHLGPLLARQITVHGDDLIRTAWHDPSKITPETIAGYHKPLQANNWDRALWELTISTTPLNLAARLHEINLPSLVITGDDDRIVPTAQSLRLANELPGARLVVISAAGHVPHEEQPQAFLDAVNAFLVDFR
jgi:pimeloyl-ACP methyl ester carboxylesterase